MSIMGELQKLLHTLTGIGRDAKKASPTHRDRSSPRRVARGRLKSRVAHQVARGAKKPMIRGKFYTSPNGGNVKIRLVKGTDDEVQAVLDRFPEGSKLHAVEAALAKIGASFTPWEDGSHGSDGRYKA